MAKVNILSVIAKHRNVHKALSGSDAYSAQEAPMLDATYETIAALLRASRTMVEAAATGQDHMIYLAANRLRDVLLCIEGAPRG